MFIDLHMHEQTYSKDSILSLEQIVEISRSKGLDGICITDHDSMGLQEYAKNYSEKIGFPIFVGIEFFSLDGDIIAFGIQDFPDKRVPAQEFIDLVKAQGGVCFSSHPFRNNNRGLEENLSKVKGLNGVEVLNASTLPEANKRAASYAQKLQLLPIGVSDCHIPEKVGEFSTYFPEQIYTMTEFIAAVKRGHCMPAYYEDQKYHILEFDESGAMRF